jgi:hypothetical protein
VVIYNKIKNRNDQEANRVVLQLRPNSKTSGRYRTVALPRKHVPRLL